MKEIISNVYLVILMFMNVIIESSLKTLNKAASLLNNIEDDVFCDTSISPYYSSIGSHIRHILDFYDCILNSNLDNTVDLTDRKRDTDVETKCSCAIEYLNAIISKLTNLNVDMNKTIFVIDDLGLGKIKMPYTYSALLAQANSHTIHHYAIIYYIIDSLSITITDSSFGYNPTTPKNNG